MNSPLLLTAAGKAFSGGTFVAGVNLGAVQLWNPVASGVMVRLSSVHFSSGNNSSAVRYTRATVALTSLGPTPVNKNFGIAAGAAAEIRNQDLGASAGTEFSRFAVATGTTFRTQFSLAEPVIIPEGFGLSLINVIAAQNMVAFFEWSELPA